MSHEGGHLLGCPRWECDEAEASLGRREEAVGRQGVEVRPLHRTTSQNGGQAARAKAVFVVLAFTLTACQFDTSR